MPYQFKKPCKFPDCAELTHDMYCEKHKKQVGRDYERYKRDAGTAKRYNAEWRKVRTRYIAAHPLCKMCEKEGRFTPAEQIHHIIPLKDGGTNDFTNLMSVCKSCHNRIEPRMP
jgi:5-methylcytosine-specific restriction protein A